MLPLTLLLSFPILGAALLGLFGHRNAGAEINVAACAATTACALWLAADVARGASILVFNEQFFIDPLNVFLVTLTAFVGLTTSIFSRPYMRIERDQGRMTAPRMRLYHAMYQLFLAMMLCALTTNNLGVLWVAMEAATLCTVLLVSVYRTPASLEAAWKYFILCGVGIVQALFGTPSM